MNGRIIALFGALLFACALSCDSLSYNRGHLAGHVSGGDRAPANITIDFGSHQISPPRPPRASDVPEGTGILRGGFELVPLDSRGWPSEELENIFDIIVTDDGVNRKVEVVAEGAREMTEALFYLKFDAECFTPVDSRDSGFLGGDGMAISLFVHRAGELAGGVARIRPDENGGVSGSGVVAEILFSPEPYRTASVNPYPNESKAHNKVVDLFAAKTPTGITLTWTEKNVGDYDNNGEVGIPDITPIALNYLRRSDDGNPEPFPNLIDGDNSGEIGIPDITPIALNYLNAVTGYNVYRRINLGGDPVFLPGDKLENPINPAARATVMRDGILDGGNPPKFALIYSFTDSTAEPASSYVFVVRPVSAPGDTPEEGLDSNVAIPEAGAASFELRSGQAEYTVGENIIIEVWVTDADNVFSSNARFDFDDSLLAITPGGIAATLGVETPNFFPDPPGSLFFGVQVDSNTIGFNNTQKRGQPGIGGEGVLAYAVFDAVAAGEAEFFIHDPSDFVWLRSPDPDFGSNKLPFGVITTPAAPLVVTINPA